MTRSVTVGVSIGADIFVASWGTSDLVRPLSSGPTQDAIRQASLEVAGMIGGQRLIRASVALLPPLARVRRIELPPMGRNDQRLAVTTNAQRYFIDVGETPVCATCPLARRGPQRDSTLLTVAASSEVIECVMTGFAAAGWVIDRIAPAQTAWAASIVHAHRRARRGTTSVIVYLPGEIEVLEIETGSLTGVRRFRPSDKRPLVDAKQGTWTIGESSEGRSAAAVAASGAKLSRVLEIVPDSVRQKRVAHERRIAKLLAAFALTSLVGAAHAYQLRLEHQLSAITARRSAIRSQASNAANMRDSTQRVVDRIAALAQLERSAPRWSAVLSHIALAVPHDVEVSSIRAGGDSLTIEGQAPDASRVLSGLQRAVGVRSTRAVSPILRELSAGNSAVERWRLALRIDHRAAVERR